MHGGLPCTLADSAMGIAYACTLDDGESFTTLELKINFLRAVKAGTLTAEGVVGTAWAHNRTRGMYGDRRTGPDRSEGFEHLYDAAR